MKKKKTMQENSNKSLLIISDSFENEPYSVSKIMTDLVLELSSKGYQIDILTMTPFKIINEDLVYNCNNINCAKYKSYRNNSFYLRAISEILFAFQIFKFLSFKNNKNYLSTIWYSPSIFISLGLYFSVPKKKLGKKIMILRDIFPDWLVDLEILKIRSISYKILKFIQKIQFKVSDVIFVQSKYDLNQLKENKNLPYLTKTELLYSWYTINNECDNEILKKINFKHNNYILILGNIETAQSHTKFIEFIKILAMKHTNEKFVFVGLRNKAQDLFKLMIDKNNITNIYLYNSIDQKAIPVICQRALCGLFSLNSNFKNNNIPGRLVMYLLNGLKTFGIFKNNDELSELFIKFKIGKTATYEDIDIYDKFNSFIYDESYQKDYIKNISYKLFSTKKAAEKVLEYVN